MERSVKWEIVKMSIPVIGVWWLLSRLIDIFGDITWWNYSNKGMFVFMGLVLYQVICILGYKVFYMMYFFGYTFDQVLN